jgi:hypothetical protein
MMSSEMESANPCLTCGACCAFYRVSFYWAEADDAHGPVPAELTEKLDHHRRAMKGTNQPQPRCVALEGEIGSCVRCVVYGHRPSVCHELKVSWEDGTPSDQCDKARRAWGLPPLEPWIFKPELPRAA